jgi:hypothetical protein
MKKKLQKKRHSKKIARSPNKLGSSQLLSTNQVDSETKLFKPKEEKISKIDKMNLSDAALAIIAAKVFEVVEGDLRERSGIGHEWNAMEQDIRKELRAENVANILSVLKELLK